MDTEEDLTLSGRASMRSRLGSLVSTRRRRVATAIGSAVVVTGVSLVAAGVFANAATGPTLDYVFGGDNNVFGNIRTTTYGPNVLTGTAADATWASVDGTNTVTKNADGSIEWQTTATGTTSSQIATHDSDAKPIIPVSSSLSFPDQESSTMNYVTTASVWGSGTMYVYWGEQRGPTEVNGGTKITLSSVPQILQSPLTGTVRDKTTYHTYIGFVVPAPGAGQTAPLDAHISNLSVSLASQIQGPKGTLALTQQTGLAVDPDGNVIVAQGFSDVVGKLTAGHYVPSVVAGTSVPGYNGDDQPANAAELHFPNGVAADAHGDIFIADTENNRVRKVSPDGTISTVAGTGVAGDSGDGGPAVKARLWQPNGVAVDAAGDLFIADTYNDVVREVDATGKITTVAGTRFQAGYSGDGRAATSARLSAPADVALDAAGDLFIVDRGNSVIRKVDATTGTITTVAGTGAAGFSGDNGPATQAQLDAPDGVAVAWNGDLYIADTLNNRVRVVDATTGDISTLVGDGTPNVKGGQAAAAEVNQPSKLAIDPTTGDLFIGGGRDQYNSASADGDYLGVISALIPPPAPATSTSASTTASTSASTTSGS